MNPVRVGDVDPAQGRDGDEVVAEITEYVDAAPVVERIGGVVTGAIDETKKIYIK